MGNVPVDMNGEPTFGGTFGGGLPETDRMPNDFAEQQDFEHTVGEGVGRPRFSRTTLALVGLFAAGIAAVGFLSLRDGPKQASASDEEVAQKVEGFIAKRQAGEKTKEPSQDTRQVVDAFYHYESRRQVPLADLKSNPFVFGDPEKEDTPAKVKPSDQEKAAAERRKALAAELTRFKLQSVMIGPRGGTAIINNNFLIEGQPLGSFTLRKIHPRSVELVADETAYTLRLEE